MKYSTYEPPRCWVGDHQKIAYQTEEEAKTAALVAQHDYGTKFDIYKCEYGNHWHLTSTNAKNKHKRS